jgi:hypothetical protein
MNAEKKTAGETAAAGQTANETRTVRGVTVAEVRNVIKARKCRSAWDRGVQAAALDMCDDMDEWAEFNKWPNGYIPNGDYSATKKMLLNGAENWIQYSLGGCALVPNADIAERFLPPSKRDAALRKSDIESDYLLNIQADGLRRAGCLIYNAIRAVRGGYAHA